MANPCVADTETIHLEADGSPAVLEADVTATSGTTSGTQGDLGLHVVTDVAVPHTQTTTYVVTNPFASKSVKGIVVASLDPVYLVPGPTMTQYSWESHLTIDGLDQDPQGDTLDWPNVTPDQNPIYIPLRAKLGQLNLAPSESVNVIVSKQIMNFGVSQTWEFNLGGDKFVAMFF